MVRNIAASTTSRPGWAITCCQCARSPSALRLEGDSRTVTRAANALRKARPAASTVAHMKPRWLRDAPIAGPMMKPMPIEAPRNPRKRARSCGGVTSATYAWAMATVPANRPAIPREMASTTSDCARPVNRNDTPDPNRQMTSSRRRPKRSESRPATAAPSSFAAE